MSPLPPMRGRGETKGPMSAPLEAPPQPRFCLVFQQISEVLAEPLSRLRHHELGPVPVFCLGGAMFSTGDCQRQSCCIKGAFHGHMGDRCGSEWGSSHQSSDRPSYVLPRCP